MRNEQERLQIIVEIGLTIALAAALNLVKVWQMPQGGSVALDMLPLFVLALRRGPVAGIIAGVLFSFVDLAMKPEIYHPLQVILDYPIAFGLVGLAGLASPAWRGAFGSKNATAATLAIVGGIVIGALGRYAAHVASGVVFFASYAPEGQPVLIYSGVYNTFVWVSAAACLAAALVVLPALERVVPARLTGEAA